MTKRLIKLDDDLLDDAQRELNTTGVSDTVRSALKQAAAAAAHARTHAKSTGCTTGGSSRWQNRRPGPQCGADRPLPSRYQRRRSDAAPSGRRAVVTADRGRRRADRRDAYEYLSAQDKHWQAAFEAQRSLARTGRHRAVGIADLLTAVLAGEHQLTLVHYDGDFDTAREVITFNRQWVAQRGSLH